MIALVREISPNISDALRRTDADPRPDLAGARREHAAYVAALRSLGAAVQVVPGDPSSADACFIEDTAVVGGHTALLTRSGAPGRRTEVCEVERALPGWLRRVVMRAPATLDGGDVLRVGRTLFVGRSERTNDVGIDVLRQAFSPEGFTVRPVEVRDALHLKCHASAVGDERVLLAHGFADPRIFDDIAEVIEVHPDEAYAANVVAIGRGVLVARGAPRVARHLSAAGFEPILLSMTEIARADGSLTCLSILLPEPEKPSPPSPV